MTLVLLVLAFVLFVVAAFVSGRERAALPITLVCVGLAAWVLADIVPSLPGLHNG